MPRAISLVIFDGDDTLWRGLDGGYISGVTYQDVGDDRFTFQPSGGDRIVRNDGQRFELYPGVRAALAGLRQLGIPVSLASYNKEAPVLSALKAFGLGGVFQYPAIQWNPEKDRMVLEIIAHFQHAGYPAAPEMTLFVDDDQPGLYRQQMERIGVPFLQTGVDLTDLRDLLNHPDYRLVCKLH